MAECVFCKIVAGEIPVARVYEDDRTLAFMDAGQVNPGHVLVAAKAHAETFMDIDQDTAAAMARTANKVAKAVEAAFAPEGVTLLQANRPAGFQTVPHVHLHVLPRHTDDGVALTWPAKNPPADELKKLAARIAVE